MQKFQQLLLDPLFFIGLAVGSRNIFWHGVHQLEFQTERQFESVIDLCFHTFSCVNLKGFETAT